MLSIADHCLFYCSIWIPNKYRAMLPSFWTKLWLKFFFIICDYRRDFSLWKSICQHSHNTVFMYDLSAGWEYIWQWTWNLVYPINVYLLQISNSDCLLQPSQPTWLVFALGQDQSLLSNLFRNPQDQVRFCRMTNTLRRWFSSHKKRYTHIPSLRGGSETKVKIVIVLTYNVKGKCAVFVKEEIGHKDWSNASIWNFLESIVLFLWTSSFLNFNSSELS